MKNKLIKGIGYFVLFVFFRGTNNFNWLITTKNNPYKLYIFLQRHKWRVILLVIIKNQNSIFRGNS